MRFITVEFSPNGDDNRPLGVSGSFLTGAYSEADIATFPSIDSALSHGAQAPNRRIDCTLEAIGQVRRAA